uniref:Ion_trans domain-containing protein n=1 Tax=Steinernema glaseri TaxID=37863 RepID=A0A1I7Z6K2_9BILA
MCCLSLSLASTSPVSALKSAYGPPKALIFFSYSPNNESYGCHVKKEGIMESGEVMVVGSRARRTVRGDKRDRRASNIRRSEKIHDVIMTVLMHAVLKKWRSQRSLKLNDSGITMHDVLMTVMMHAVFRKWRSQRSLKLNDSRIWGITIFKEFDNRTYLELSSICGLIYVTNSITLWSYLTTEPWSYSHKLAKFWATFDFQFPHYLQIGIIAIRKELPLATMLIESYHFFLATCPPCWLRVESESQIVIAKSIYYVLPALSFARDRSRVNNETSAVFAQHFIAERTRSTSGGVYLSAGIPSARL